MQGLSSPTGTVLSNKKTRNGIVISFKDSPRKPLGRRPREAAARAHLPCTAADYEVCSLVSSAAKANFIGCYKFRPSKVRTAATPRAREVRRRPAGSEPEMVTFPY